MQTRKTGGATGCRSPKDRHLSPSSPGLRHPPSPSSGNPPPPSPPLSAPSPRRTFLLSSGFHRRSRSPKPAALTPRSSTDDRRRAVRPPRAPPWTAACLRGFSQSTLDWTSGENFKIVLPFGIGPILRRRHRFIFPKCRGQNNIFNFSEAVYSISS